MDHQDWSTKRCRLNVYEIEHWFENKWPEVVMRKSKLLATKTIGPRLGFTYFEDLN